MHAGMILVDLQKAFDSLDHGVLLEKMEYFGFRESVIKWFESYLSNRKFLVCIDVFSEAGTLRYGVPQGSILGPLLFLLYVNDLPQSLSDAGSYLYADATCIFYQHEEVKKIENVLNKEFSSLCQWFIDSKLSIHFGEDKTKSILFSKTRDLKEINISFGGHSIKQHKTAEYLGCQLDSKLRREAMASKVLKKINAKLKFLYRQRKYLTLVYRRPLCNALIQPHFDYGCSSWFPLQKAQNKCIRFCLNLPPRSHINPSHFRKINWLPVNDRVDNCIANTFFKYWDGMVPGYIHDMFKTSLCRYSTRSQMALDMPLRKTNTGQKNLSFLGPKIWSNIGPSIKNVRTSSSFMHAIKKKYFTSYAKLIQVTIDIII